MPTVLREGPYRFFFYAGDRDEPPHVHVESGGKVAKFWLEPLRLQRSGRFTRPEINEMHGIIAGHRDLLLEAWHEYFRG